MSNPYPLIQRTNHLILKRASEKKSVATIIQSTVVSRVVSRVRRNI
jgi:hypothetical protein